TDSSVGNGNASAAAFDKRGKQGLFRSFFQRRQVPRGHQRPPLWLGPRRGPRQGKREVGRAQALGGNPSLGPVHRQGNSPPRQTSRSGLQHRVLSRRQIAGFGQS